MYDFAAAPETHQSHTSMAKATPWIMNWTTTAQVREKQEKQLVTYGWEKDLAEIHLDVGNILGVLSGISFEYSLDLYQKTQQLGNTGRNSMEKHKMRNTLTHRGNSQIYIWRCNKAFARKHFSFTIIT